MQLHVGITPDLVPTLLDAVITSRWAGARSSRDVGTRTGCPPIGR
ncbi:MAG: hypothetical protein V9G12_19595 [Microthrixaceae bacterium]